jgi:HlyD family secretion protein
MKLSKEDVSQMRIRQIVAVLSLLLFLIVTTACGQTGKDSAGRDDQQLVAVTKGDLVIWVNGTGHIETAREVKLSFGNSGKLAKVYVREGDEVKEGDILAELDTDRLELALTTAQVALAGQELAVSQAEVNVKNSEIALEKAKDSWLDTESAGIKVKRLERSLEWYLEEDQEDHERIALIRLDLREAWNRFLQIASDSTDSRQVIAKEIELELGKQSVGQMKYSLEQFQLALEQAQKDLTEATIMAPFNGAVASIGAEEGDRITPGISVVHLVDSTSMEFIIEVDEIDVPGVRLDQEAIIDVDALPDITYEGRVTSIYPIPATIGGIVAYNVRISFEVPEDSDLKIGMNASADISIRKRSNVLLVPNQAIEKDSQGNQMVRVMENEQIQERMVVTGMSDGSVIEIMSGLIEGEVVIV